MRIYVPSKDTTALNRWDYLFAQIKSKPTIPADNVIPDISGDWVRTDRAMECRNADEAPGLKWFVTPNGSRSEVSPPDIDRATKRARMLHWFITNSEITGKFTGSGAGSAHDHGSVIEYTGMVDGQHVFKYTTTRSVLDKTQGEIKTDMYGVLVVDLDEYGKPRKLTSVVYDNDGRDPDLPKTPDKVFKEISIWKLNAAPA